MCRPIYAQGNVMTIINIKESGPNTAGLDSARPGQLGPGTIKKQAQDYSGLVTLPSSPTVLLIKSNLI